MQDILIQNVSSCLVYIEKFLIGGGCWTIHDDGKSKREKEEVSSILWPHVFGRIPSRSWSFLYITGTARPSQSGCPGLSNTTQITMCAHQQLRCTAAARAIQSHKRRRSTHTHMCVYTFGIHGTQRKEKIQSKKQSIFPRFSNLFFFELDGQPLYYTKRCIIKEYIEWNMI